MWATQEQGGWNRTLVPVRLEQSDWHRLVKLLKMAESGCNHTQCATFADPQEAHPAVYYADYRCDSANDSLSNRFAITESSSAVLSNNDEDSNADDRTVGSSNSLGSLTTVENFENAEFEHSQHQGHGK